MEYAKKLRERIPFFENAIYRPLDGRPRQTEKGARGIENAISYLEKLNPSTPFSIFSGGNKCNPGAFEKIKYNIKSMES